VALGAGVGLVGSITGLGVMESLLFEVSPSDPWALVTAPVILLTAAALAIWAPVLRYTRVDPAVTMRAE
jgi:hypothetical protein